MIITIISTDYTLFNQLVEEIDIMIPVYPFTKPYIANVNWSECILKLYADGDYHHIFISMLKRFIIAKKIKISINLPFYPLAIYNSDNVPTENWLIEI